MKEITFEITNYCPNECSYCSSDAVTSRADAVYADLSKIRSFLEMEDPYDRINISGGEPLAHTDFWFILQVCKQHVTPRIGYVAVYTNAFDCIMYNANVIPGIRLEANVPMYDNVDKVHILKMVEQGREAKKAEIHKSCNFEKQNCEDCGHVVVRPDGSRNESPCRKFKEKE